MDSNEKIIIIGCGAGGGTAAQFARKTNRKAEITVFEKGCFPQYSKCGLPYSISGIIKEPEDLIEFTEEWFSKQKIELFLNTTVEKIDTTKKVVFAKKENETIEKPYDKIIISTGAIPFTPSIENIYNDKNLADGVFSLRTIDDAKKIKNYCTNKKNAVVIGAGLIGLEMADNLKKLGLNVTVVEALSSILANNLDEDMAKIVFDEVSKHVTVFTDHFATRFEDSKIVIKNKTSGEEKTIPADVLIVATGCKPNVSLAESIGCKIGNTRGIIVNNKSETSIENVYAIGDCTEFIDFIYKKPVPVGLGSIAVRQAIAAGTNAAGGKYELSDGVLMTSTSEFFDLEIGAVGVISDRAEEVIVGKFNGSSLPEYFPGGKTVTVKVVADSNGKILGAQIVGDKAAQRVNSFATAILGGLDIESFRKLETAYAPPIAPTLDAITLACDIVSMKLARKR